MFSHLLAPIRLFIEWWSGLHPSARLGLPLGLLGFSGVMRVQCRVFIIGWVVGVLLLLCSGKSDAEKKGCRF